MKILQEKLLYLLLVVMFVLNIAILSFLSYEIRQGSGRRDLILRNQVSLEQTQIVIEGNQEIIINNQLFVVCVLKSIAVAQIVSQTDIDNCLNIDGVTL